MRISPLLLCLPYFAVLAPCTPAVAGMAPAEATALLAKTLVLDKRCNILSSDAHQELQDFVARAEIALAELQSVEVARAALAKGRASGAIGECGPEQAKLVNDVLAEARKGVGIETGSPAEVDAAADPVIPAAQPRKVVAAAEPKAQVTTSPRPDIAVLAVAVEPQAKQKPKLKPLKKPEMAKVSPEKSEKILKAAKTPQKLSQYASLAQKYYLARRCNTMGATAIKRLYGNVLSIHKQAMASNPASDVKAMLRSVEAKAGSQSCS